MKLRILADLRNCTLALFLFVQHLRGLPPDSGMVVQSSSPVSALAVVTKSLQLAASDLQLRKNYTYQERQVEKHMDASGNIRKTIVHTYDIVIVGQTRLARLIAKTCLQKVSRGYQGNWGSSSAAAIGPCAVMCPKAVEGEKLCCTSKRTSRKTKTARCVFPQIALFPLTTGYTTKRRNG